MKTVSEKEFNPDQPVFVVFWSFRVEGPVEPRDVIGTLYSATEGLFGGGRGLEDLIKDGDVESTPYVRIGHEGAKAWGRIHVQTRMGPEGTARLAAALETIDEIGPGYDAEIRTERIKYTRGGRKRLAELRAHKIVQDENLWVTELSSENEKGLKEGA